jgi:hypothetical protein
MEKAVRKKQKVADMADEVQARQARSRAERTGESFEEALKAVLETKAGRQLGELRAERAAGEQRPSRECDDPASLLPRTLTFHALG